LMTSSYISEQPRTMINHMSQDFINILGELEIRELNNTFVNELIANGTVTNLNNTIIEQIGEFWAEDNIVMANQFTQNVTEGVLSSRYGYSIIIGNDTVYTRTNPVENSLVTSKKIISGIQKAKPIKGFVAKARAVSIDKQSVMRVAFSPEGSGWDGRDSDKGFVYITKYFDLTGLEINNVSFHLSMHLEDGGSDYTVVNLNGGVCTINKDSLNFGGEEGLFEILDVSSCLVNGMNHVHLALWNDGYNAHLHPGMQIEIHYNQSENISYLTSEHSERYYFDNIRSVEADGDGSGAWAMLPFHVPPDVENVSARLQLNLQDVNDLQDRYWSWGWKYRDAWDFRIYVNSDSTYYQQNPGDATDINDCLSDGAACGAEYDWTGSFNITDEVEDGTNLVSVYVNNYGDTVGGDGDTVIYSDPINDSANSSFVEINYTLTPALPYGAVEIRQTQDFGGSPDPTKDTNFQFPSEAEAISSVFAYVAEQYSYMTRVYADTGYVPGNMVFESPSSRAVPTDVYIPEDTLDVSEVVTNYIRLDETSSNDIRPESSIDYGFYVPSFVGFGEVFATAALANADALQRLQDEMGSFVNVSDFILQNNSMADVPSMWGPAVVEVRVWT
ncbi:hypothetical protein ACFL0V_06790, partial [Nanoarchaeota archaeon]